MIAMSRAPEIGLVLCALGAAVIAIGVIAFLRNPNTTVAYRQRWWTLGGAMTMALGFLVQLAGTPFV
jgi:multisubunit Na+/H+ antiporter MnhB subunit